MSRTINEKKRMISVVVSFIILLSSIIYIAYYTVGYVKEQDYKLASNITYLSTWKKKDNIKKLSVYNYKRDDCRIKIVVRPETKTDAVLDLIEMLDKAPAYLLEGCNQIIMAHNDISNEVHIEENENDGEAYEYHAFTDGEVVVYNDSHFDKETFYHELAHVYDYQNNMSTSSAFKDIRSKNTFLLITRLSMADDYDDRERWAIASSIYLTSPETVKDIDEDIYEFFANIYGYATTNVVFDNT